MVKTGGGRGRADLPVKLRLSFHQEPAGVLFHQVNLSHCRVAAVGLGWAGSAQVGPRSVLALSFLLSLQFVV